MQPHHHAVAEPEATTHRQRTFVRYFIAIAADLVVLNLLAQFWGRLSVDGFLTTLIAAVLLQLLLQGTLIIEHKAAAPFVGKTGLWKVGRILVAWLILFVSKFVMLWVIGLILGDAIQFHGAMHGAGAFIVTIIAMVVAEERMYRAFRALGTDAGDD